MSKSEARRAKKVGTVAEARALAQKRLPKVVFDYIDGGAGAEVTMHQNIEAVNVIGFRPRMGVTNGLPGPDLSVTVLGKQLSMPIIVGPVGFSRAMQRGGDVAGARAAAQAGTQFALSSMSGNTMEEVARAYRGARGDISPTKPWFQLYPVGGRRGSERLLDMARKAGYGALVVTVDSQFPGNRERDIGHRVSLPLPSNLSGLLRFAPQGIVRPRWLLGALRDRFRFEVVAATMTGTKQEPVSSTTALVEWVFSPLKWEDFSWIKDAWSGPIIAKGILSADDARRALGAGADALVVSNHGGRQLDGSPPTMRALVDVVRAVGDTTEVLVDGGIRRGQDVVRAVALGAKAVLVGRAWAYGLSAAGEAGIVKILSVLRQDIDRTLRLLGADSIADLDRSYVTIPKDWEITRF